MREAAPAPEQNAHREAQCAFCLPVAEAEGEEQEAALAAETAEEEQEAVLAAGAVPGGAGAGVGRLAGASGV